MTIKPGVRIVGLKPETLLAITVVASVYEAQRRELVITSAVEGRHSRASLHYAGYAFDCRIPCASDVEVSALVARLKSSLGADFDVVLESDHIHVEFQPKEALAS